MTNWSSADALKVYNLPYWGGGFFHLDDNGNVVVAPDKRHPEHRISLVDIIEELRKQGADDIVVFVGGVIPRQDYDFLYEAGVKQSLEEARNLFDGLRSPRKDLLGQLLSCCASVKAVRLFLTWARETSLVDVDALLEQYPVRTGSNTRWMSRLDDGTLLSLRPHG